MSATADNTITTTELQEGDFVVVVDHPTRSGRRYLIGERHDSDPYWVALTPATKAGRKDRRFGSFSCDCRGYAWQLVKRANSDIVRHEK